MTVRQTRTGWWLAGLTGTFLCASVWMPDTAYANGRYPLAQQLLVDPDNADRLWLRATYGIMNTADNAPGWGWLCESVVGYGGTEDPFLGLMSNGTMIAGLTVGLSVSNNYGCDWDFVEGPLNGAFVLDVAVSPGETTRALAMAASVRADGSFLNQVYETKDNAVTWTQLGEDLDESMVVLTLDPAPSDPERIYLSGLNADSEGVLLRSSDNGSSWQSLKLADTSSARPPYIAAVHPTDADQLFIRVNGTETDQLLYTTDGGESFSPLIEQPTKLFGFALSPDGAEVLVGFGDRPDVSDGTAPELGIWRSRIGEFDFQKIFDGPVYCLNWSPAGLYACTSRLRHGFDLGFASRVDFDLSEPMPFTPRLWMSEICGVPSCAPETTTATLCAQLWPEACSELALCGGDATTAGGAPQTRGCGDTGGAEPSVGAGGTSSPADVEVGGGPGAPPAATPAGKAEGCSMALKPAQGSWLMLFLAALFLQRRYKVQQLLGTVEPGN